MHTHSHHSAPYPEPSYVVLQHPFAPWSCKVRAAGGVEQLTFKAGGDA